MGKLTVVVGGQLGSEGKGAIAAYLGRYRAPIDLATDYVRVAGPNAGHTVIGRERASDPASDRRAYKLRAVPVGAVSNPHARLLVAAGSEVDRDVLAAELNELDEHGYRASQRLAVDAQATLLTKKHTEREQAEGYTDRFGSTSKGIGAARMDRLARSAELYGGDFDVTREAQATLAIGGHTVIEGTQGYGLGLHAGFYPYCTSSDCRALDFLAMAGISPWSNAVDQLEIWVVLRVFPIRVAGNSGPLVGETSWEALGLPAERTTVTNKVRRVGAWDPALACDAIEANGGRDSRNVHVALTMFDQAVPATAGLTSPYEDEWPAGARDALEQFEEDIAMPIELVGTGPDTVIDRRRG